MVGSLIGVSMPIFWLGLMEIMLFAVILGWLPTGGRLSTGIEIQIDHEPLPGRQPANGKY